MFLNFIFHSFEQLHSSIIMNAYPTHCTSVRQVKYFVWRSLPNVALETLANTLKPCDTID